MLTIAFTLVSPTPHDTEFSMRQAAYGDLGPLGPMITAIIEDNVESMSAEVMTLTDPTHLDISRTWDETAITADIAGAFADAFTSLTSQGWAIVQ